MNILLSRQTDFEPIIMWKIGVTYVFVFNPYSTGIDFRRHNLTSVDIIKCPNWIYPIHLNTYVMGLRPLQIFLLFQCGDWL